MTPDPAPSGARPHRSFLWRASVTIEVLVLVIGALWLAVDATRPTMVAVAPAAGDRPAAERGEPAVLSLAARPGLACLPVTSFEWVADHDAHTVPGAGAHRDAPIPPALAQVTPTYDGSGQANHPSVVDFLAEYGMAKWGGHRYWMVDTPYREDSDAFENPSVLVSDDGAKWSPAPGLRSPLVGPPADYKRLAVHFSDPELVYDPGADTLDVFFRENRGAEATASEDLRRIDISSKDGTLSTTVHLPVPTRYTRDTEIMSPGIVLGDDGTWHMWFVSFYPEGGSLAKTGTLRILHATSPDGLSWSEPASCSPSPAAFYATVAPRPWRPFSGDPFYPWHLEAKRTGGTVRLLVDTTMLASRPSLGEGSGLYLAETTLADPARLSWLTDAPLVAGTAASAVYRASFVSGTTDRVWFSARDAAGAMESGARWRIGFTEGRIRDREWEPASSITVPLDVAPGTWWLHVRARNALGVWSNTMHVRETVPER